VQCVEICNAIVRQVNDLSVDDQRCTQSRGFLYDARVAFRPIVPVHRVEAHAAVPNVHLEPVSVMLQLVRPTGAGGRLLGDDWLAGVDETGRRVPGPAA